MQLFYTPDISPQHRSFILNEGESKHAVRVLRMAAGQDIHLVDGQGGLYTGVVKDAHPKRLVLDVVDVKQEYGKRPYYLHIAVAPTKNIDRLEWFLEKATEVGVDEITPIVCKHSERKDVKITRLNKVVASAMKQSLKAYLPVLHEATSFDSLLAQPFEGTRIVAHCADGEKKQINQLAQSQGRCQILIGPEGDFSPAEIETALAAGFHPATLGVSRLRTETAALVSTIEVALLNR